MLIEHLNKDVPGGGKKNQHACENVQYVHESELWAGKLNSIRLLPVTAVFKHKYWCVGGELVSLQVSHSEGMTPCPVFKGEKIYLGIIL